MSTKYDIKFTKAVGSGNDFIIIDNKDRALDPRGFDYGEMARDLCRRNLSIGADGILVLESSTCADFKMRIINPDGSEVDMCGNGARCSAVYAETNGWGHDLSFETGAGIIRASVKESMVKLRMSDPKDLKLDVDVDSPVGKIHFVNTGVPHVVKIVDDIDQYPVKENGRMLREHPFFAPDGTNVNFVSVTGDEIAKIRTYERGVEDETLACGTGTVASAIILGVLGKVSSPVNMLTASGEILTVYYEISGEKVSDVYLEGIAKTVYEGRV